MHTLGFEVAAISGGGGAGGDGNQKHGLAKVTFAEKIKTIFKSLERFKKGTE